MSIFAAMPQRTSSHITPEVVGGRLALLEAAYGKTGREMARLLGIGEHAWSKYKLGMNEFSYRHALALKDEFGVSLEWIYGGGRAYNSEAFNRTLDAWEARDKSADPPRRGRPTKRKAHP